MRIHIPCLIRSSIICNSLLRLSIPSTLMNFDHFKLRPYIFIPTVCSAGTHRNLVLISSCQLIIKMFSLYKLTAKDLMKKQY